MYIYIIYDYIIFFTEYAKKSIQNRKGYYVYVLKKKHNRNSV